MALQVVGSSGPELYGTVTSSEPTPPSEISLGGVGGNKIKFQATELSNAAAMAYTVTSAHVPTQPAMHVHFHNHRTQ